MDEPLLLLIGWPFLRRWFGQPPATDPGTGNQSANEILRQRYARGEITRDQFEAMRRVLGDEEQPAETERQAA